MINIREKIKGKSDILPNITKIVETDFNADGFILQLVKNLENKPPNWKVDPFQLEANFEDVGRLLERLLDLRRDLWELSAVIQTKILQYISTVEQAEADNALQIAQASDLVRKNVEDAALKRISAVRESIALLEARHGEPGNALNYAERLYKLRDVLTKDIESCYVRSLAVSAETKDRYALDVPMPATSENKNLLYVDFIGAAFLDDWSAWYRKLARELELKQSAEPIHEIVISLGRYQLVESFDDSRGDTEEAIVLLPDLTKDVASGKGIEFNLDLTDTPKPGVAIQRRIIPSLCGAARIVGLQVSIETTAEEEGNSWRFNVEVRPPMAARSVLLTATSSATSPNWLASSTFLNRPAKGAWHLRVTSAVAENSSPEQAKREAWPITDVKLSLRLSGA